MNLERLKQAWNEQGKRILLSKDPHTMIAGVRRKQRANEWACFALIGIGIAMAALFALWGPPWLAKEPLVRYASSVPFLFMSLFLIFDMTRRRRKQRTTVRSVMEALDVHLEQITREIRLLRSVAWWALLPMGIPIQIILTAGYVQILRLEHWAFPLAVFVILNVFCVGLFYGAYRFCQFDVTSRLALRKAELDNMLRDLLEDEQANDDPERSK